MSERFDVVILGAGPAGEVALTALLKAGQTAALDWPELSVYRDYMVSNHDDSKRIANYEERGVTVVKDRGVIAGPGRIEAGGRELEAGAIVVATGADAVIPPIPGLAE